MVSWCYKDNVGTLSKMVFDHLLSACFTESHFGLRNCSAHTPASCKTLRDSWTISTALSLRERWKWTMRARLRPRHAHSIPGQGLSDHHYRLYSVRICVELQPFAILWRNQGIWHHFSRGQDSPTIQYQHSPSPSLYFHWREKTRHRHEKRHP